MKKSILILLMILIFILPSCSSHETTDCRIVLERLMTAEIGLPAGKVYCMAAQRGDDEYLPQNLINSLYGGGSRPVMADGWIDLAVYLSTTPHPCELAVFLCDKEETARDTATMLCSRIDAIRTSKSSQEYSPLLDSATVTVIRNYVLLVVSSDVEGAITEAAKAIG